MKTVVYAIAKNEEAHAAEFMTNCKAADLVVVADSGSTDRTREIVQDMGGVIVPVSVSPWRFDVARNTALSVLPADVDLCYRLDLDERFQSPNWRDLLESQWQPGKHTRLRFRFIHNFSDNGTAGTTGVKDFAHARQGYLWQHAVHEQLYYYGDEKEQVLSLP